MDDRDAGYLWDIVQRSRSVIRITAGCSLEDFESDEMLRLAVERQVGVIGEAARRVSPAFRDAHPEIPWSAIVAHRNILTHEYGRIDLNRLWVVASERVPELLGLIEPLIPPLPEEPD